MGGTTIATTLVVGTLLETVYHWQPQNLGLFTLTMLVASLATVPTTGVLGDQVIKFMAKRDKGQHKVCLSMKSLFNPIAHGPIPPLGTITL